MPTTRRHSTRYARRGASRADQRFAAWGAVVWLTACVSMAAVEVFFPQVYGGRLIVVGIEGLLLFAYLALAIQ